MAGTKVWQVHAKLPNPKPTPRLNKSSPGGKQAGESATHQGRSLPQHAEQEKRKMDK